MNKFFILAITIGIVFFGLSIYLIYNAAQNWGAAESSSAVTIQFPENKLSSLSANTALVSVSVDAESLGGDPEPWLCAEKKWIWGDDTETISSECTELPQVGSSNIVIFQETHTYSAPGKYDIQVILTSSDGKKVKSDVVNIDTTAQTYYPTSEGLDSEVPPGHS